MQVSLVVLTKKELLHLLSRLKLFYEARGTWEPEAMDKRPRMQRKGFSRERRGNQMHATVRLEWSSWGAFSG